MKFVGAGASVVIACRLFGQAAPQPPAFEVASVKQGYRTNMLNVGYWIAQDRNSLLSYSYDGGVMTIDPVSTGNPGWPEFLTAYNQFCSAHGGIPLFNQTDGITPAQAQLALGGRLKTFAAARPAYDPTGRLLNAYFRELLGEASPPNAAPIK